jgi:hypothetical protein
VSDFPVGRVKGVFETSQRDGYATVDTSDRQRRIAGCEGAVGGAVVSHCELTMAMTTVGPCGRFLSLVFAVLGTDLGTERGEFGANTCDVVRQAGRRNAIDLNV